MLIVCRMSVDRRDLKLPEFTPATITRLINKRNHKFRHALNSHLESSSKQVYVPFPPTALIHQGQEAWIALIEMATRYYPSNSSDLPSKLSQESSPPLQAKTFSMRDLIHELQNSEDYHDQIVPDGHRSFPEHLAEYGTVHQFHSLNSRRTFPALVYRTRGSSHQSKRHFTNVYSSGQGDQRS